MLTQSCRMYHAFRPRLGFRVRERPGVSIGKEGEYEFGRDRRTATRGVQSPRAGYACFRPVFRGMGAGVAAGDPVSGALRVVEHPDKRGDRPRAVYRATWWVFRRAPLLGVLPGARR